jgi:hypothetical protein
MPLKVGGSTESGRRLIGRGAKLSKCQALRGAKWHGGKEEIWTELVTKYVNRSHTLRERRIGCGESGEGSRIGDLRRSCSQAFKVVAEVT